MDVAGRLVLVGLTKTEVKPMNVGGSEEGGGRRGGV